MLYEAEPPDHAEGHEHDDVPEDDSSGNRQPFPARHAPILNLEGGDLARLRPLDFAIGQRRELARKTAASVDERVRRVADTPLGASVIFDGRAHERRKQRVRFVGFALELWMELASQKERMARKLNHLD